MGYMLTVLAGGGCDQEHMCCATSVDGHFADVLMFLEAMLMRDSTMGNVGEANAHAPRGV
jgi:hypothetical protein